MLFKEVVGHTEIKENLIITVKENTISHAQLFSGKEGYGHFSLAIAYAQYILCNEPNESDSCGLCASCKKVGQFSHPDLHFSFPVHLSKANKINQSDDMLSEFRAMLLEDIHIGKNHWYDLMGNQNKQGVIGVTESESIVKKLSLKSFEGGYKILIMWLPESMNINAANKLLKIIEILKEIHRNPQKSVKAPLYIYVPLVRAPPGETGLSMRKLHTAEPSIQQESSRR